jgi:hypothetical protein
MVIDPSKTRSRFAHGRLFVAAVLLLAFSGDLSATPHSAPSEEINTAIASAREDLRSSTATEKRVAAELERMKTEGTASPDTIADYELYLERVRAMVAQNRETLRQLEQLQARQTISTAGADRTGAAEETSSGAIPEEQLVDEVDALDREFDQSLAAFDEMLLKELELIRMQSAERMRDLSDEAAAAAERLRRKGIDIEAEESEPEGESETSEADTVDSGAPEADAEVQEPAAESGQGPTDRNGPEGVSDEDVARSDDNGGATPGAPAESSRRTGVEDDDIVARQLREAAEKETDPELKEKLWKEYEDYKRGQP